MTKDFLQVTDLTAKEVAELLDLATALRRRRHGRPRVLQNTQALLLFEKPSLRTRVTFEIAVRELGGDAMTLGASEVGLGVRESVEDVAQNLERWVHIAIVRTFSHATIERLADAAPRLRVINALTDGHHPCQALADALTLRQHLGKRLSGRRLAWIGDGNNVCHSLMQVAALTGMHMSVATPRGYRPHAKVVAGVREIAARTKARLEIGSDPVAAVKGADAIYTDVWASMGQEREAVKRRRLFAPFQLNRRLLRAARPGAIVLHCLPAHRGEEITSDVLDSEQSVVLDQAENRLHAQKALLVMISRPPRRRAGR